jgi:hypothetical protein
MIKTVTGGCIPGTGKELILRAVENYKNSDEGLYSGNQQ